MGGYEDIDADLYERIRDLTDEGYLGSTRESMRGHPQAPSFRAEFMTENCVWQAAHR
jgi:hypothetical protein